jgi:uncharacterized repeat protein (TIGR03803 family)
VGGLIADANGNLFGTTEQGGSNNDGTVFEITNSGFVTVQPTLSPSGGDLNAGKTVTITLSTSEAVTVTGTPTATLNDGGTATYNAAKSNATSLSIGWSRCLTSSSLADSRTTTERRSRTRSRRSSQTRNNSWPSPTTADRVQASRVYRRRVRR